jgi:hypothetical protein
VREGRHSKCGETEARGNTEVGDHGRDLKLRKAKLKARVGLA